MKLVQQSVEYLPQEDLFKQIELAARTCYKSEDKITSDSAKKMVDGLIKAGHNAMLEHGTVYLIERYLSNEEKPSLFNNIPYTKIFERVDEVGGLWRFISTNMRVLVERNMLDLLDIQDIGVHPTKYHEKRYTFRIVTSIGIVRELIRHRAFSFANESTRYCNYSKDKFEKELTFILPSYLEELPWAAKDSYKTQILSESFYKVTKEAEKQYMMMLDEGATPQQAREVLPLCTKSELVMTGFEDDWKRFLDIRLEGTTGKPHPDMVELAKMIKDKLDKIKNNES